MKGLEEQLCYTYYIFSSFGIELIYFKLRAQYIDIVEPINLVQVNQISFKLMLTQQY
jgi:hypothetical protein